MPTSPSDRAVLVPGLRTPWGERADTAVFRPLVHHLTRRSDPPVDQRGVMLHVPYRGRGRPRLVPFARALRDGTAWSYRIPLDDRATTLAAALTTLARTEPGPVTVVGYSVGGNAAVMALGRLPVDVRASIACVVTLGAPFAGFDVAALGTVFGPPMLDRAIPWLLRAQDVVVPGIDCSDAAVGIAAASGVPVLTVAVGSDPVAPPDSALLGRHTSAPCGTQWLEVAPRTGLPVQPWRTPADLPVAIPVLAAVHAEVVLRRDVIAAVGRFVDGARRARAA